MFRNLLPRLFGEDVPSSGLTADDADMAIAALLVRIARADNRYQDAEKARIDALLGHRHHLGPAEAADRRAAAEMLEAEAPDTVRFTRAVKDRVPLDQRIGIVAALWDIALVDGHRTPGEDAAVRLVAGLLGVSDVDSARARQSALRSAPAQDNSGDPAAAAVPPASADG